MDVRLSSHKRGHGIRELLSKNLSEIWSTDNSLPHGILITFDTLTYVEEARLYLSYSQDDSYTPQEIEIRAGLTEHAIDYAKAYTLVDPEGYVSMDVKHDCLFLQIIILSNYQEGKDSHIRHLVLMETKEKEMFIKLKDHY